MKKIQTLVFSMIFVSFFCISASAVQISDFSDVQSSDWYYKYVEKLLESKITNGTSETTFSPQGTFTLLECATVITRYLGLEGEAKKYSAEMKNQTTIGCDLWYSGYIQVMHELSIFNISDYGMTLQNGLVSISSPESLSVPITRQEFAVFIAKSFETKGNFLSKNVAYGIGGRGHEFIVGGAYDSTSLNQYSTLINDYSEINPYYTDYVLKMYYNGIFAGDNLGNFNPNKNLTRAEMAKVICVVTNFDMREQHDFRNLPPQCILTENDYIKDTTGNLILKREKAYDILKTISDNALNVEGIEKDTTKITFTQLNLAPKDYTCEAIIYTDGEKKLSTITKLTLADENAHNQYYSISANVTNNSFQILLILRNLKNNAQVDGILIITRNSNGDFSFSDGISK